MGPREARGAVSAELGNLRDLERWIGWIRLGAIRVAERQSFVAPVKIAI